MFVGVLSNISRILSCSANFPLSPCTPALLFFRFRYSGLYLKNRIVGQMNLETHMKGKKYVTCRKRGACVCVMRCVCCDVSRRVCCTWLNVRWQWQWQWRWQWRWRWQWQWHKSSGGGRGIKYWRRPGAGSPPYSSIPNNPPSTRPLLSSSQVPPHRPHPRRGPGTDRFEGAVGHHRCCCGQGV